MSLISGGRSKKLVGFLMLVLVLVLLVWVDSRSSETVLALRVLDIFDRECIVECQDGKAEGRTKAVERLDEVSRSLEGKG
jgi:hypothetical protein